MPVRPAPPSYQDRPNKRGGRVRHPLFARFYERLAAAAEDLGAREHRQRLLAGLDGVVLEVGAGNGMNFAHYPATVTEVIAVEPEPYLRSRAELAGARAPIRIRVVDGDAEHLPLPDGCVDAAVASLVLCSVADQAAALQEMHRVVRPGGELHFYEHVAATNQRWARRQRHLDPLWSRVGGGCHLTRDTERAIAQAGFRIEDVDRFRFQPSWMHRLSAEHILGRARRS